jgi:hypothetical protein
MANSSSTPNIPASLSIPVSEKLTREKFQLWHAQVVPTIRAAQLEGFIEGTERVPMKTIEVEKDSKKVLILNPDYATYKDHQCQICGKLSHTALRCWKHFDKGYNGPKKTAHAATTSYTLDPA